jgi:hypothetical protein
VKQGQATAGVGKITYIISLEPKLFKTNRSHFVAYLLLDASDAPPSIKIKNFNCATYKSGSILRPFNYQNDLYRPSPPPQPQVSVVI